MNKPSLNVGVYHLYLLLFLILPSCGSFTLPSFNKSNKGDLAGKGYSEMSADDYRDHLASLKQPFLSTPGIKVYPINKAGLKYLDDTAAKIIGNNEIFFKQLKGSKVTILDIEAPLHFSLPKGEIFLSKGLIAKYIKHESMLVSILSYELVRSEKLLYPKETIIPTGYLPLERIITLNRLTLEEKMEVHKWAFHLTIRSGYDGEYYLSWLQVQNRNTADFIMQVGDANQINREESLFKAFLIKHSVEDNIITKKSSSKSFYSLLNGIRDGAI
ncbi:MAG TPA: hypothetical protein VNJ08_10035 [Bacteriovoracaceae bacterium]|nr:hypothetical protein [Bacteriovoracaceae bacterium]